MVTHAKGHHVFAIHGDRHGNVWAATEAEFVKAADQALYRAEAGGRNQIAA